MVPKSSPNNNVSCKTVRFEYFPIFAVLRRGNVLKLVVILLMSWLLTCMIRRNIHKYMRDDTVEILPLQKQWNSYYSVRDRDKYFRGVPETKWDNTYMELKVKARLGNQMFAYAALREFSTRKNSTPIILPDHEDIASIFKLNHYQYLDIDRSNFVKFTETRRNISVTLAQINRLRPGNISFRGYFHSPGYFETVKHDIRREFEFVNGIAKKARRYLMSIVPKQWLSRNYIQVAVHVRRTDHVSYKFTEKLGFRFPPISYFKLAFDYFEKRYSRVQFVVASDDLNWCMDFFRFSNATIVYSANHTAAEDLAILAYCNHSITTIGTFSWWTGWLCPGTTIYYVNYYRPHSWVSAVLSPDHFIPRDEYNNWVGVHHKDDKGDHHRKIWPMDKWKVATNS